MAVGDVLRGDTYSEPTKFDNGLEVGGQAERSASKALNVTAGSPQIRFGESDSEAGAILMSFTDNDFIAAAGMDFDSNTSNWIATSTGGSSYLRMVSGQAEFWTAPSSAVGANLTPVSRLLVSATGVDIWGTTTNDSAATGYVGEYVEAVAADASVTSWSSGTFKNITSISLTAGDWDVGAVAMFGGSGGTITGTNLFAEISKDSAAAESNVYAINETDNMPNANVNQRLPVPIRRISVASTTTVYLVGRVVFSGGTPTAGGWLYARRVR